MKLLCKLFGHKWHYYIVGRHWADPPHNVNVRECERCLKYEKLGIDTDV